MTAPRGAVVQSGAMPVRCLVRPGSYFDSVVLMRIAAELGARPGVRAASLVMATASNKDVLEAAGLLADEARAAGANDLVVAIDAAEDAAGDALAAAEEALSARAAPPAARRRRAAAPAHARRGRATGAQPRDVSTPGRYAAAEALKALRLGLNAFVFSDNVPIEQEIELKREAHARGLIVMGPDCGTAIVGGVPLGFANEVRAGDIGLIGASGHRAAAGLVPDRPLGRGREPGARRRQPRPRAPPSAAISMLDALDALAADPATRCSAWSPSRPTRRSPSACSRRAAASGKPVVAAFLGADPDGAPDGVTMAATLEEAARLLVRASTGGERPRRRPTDAPGALTAPRGSAACCAGCTPAARSPTRRACCSRPRLGRDRPTTPTPPARRPPGARCPTRTSSSTSATTASPSAARTR